MMPSSKRVTRAGIPHGAAKTGYRLAPLVPGSADAGPTAIAFGKTYNTADSPAAHQIRSVQRLSDTTTTTERFWPSSFTKETRSDELPPDSTQGTALITGTLYFFRADHGRFRFTWLKKLYPHSSKPRLGNHISLNSLQLAKRAAQQGGASRTPISVATTQ